jgi:hypothetical protein
MSHSYSVPSLKRVCIYILEQGWLTKENVIDVLQLARKCDAPRLSLICIRIIVRDFKTIPSTEAWKVMKLSSPELEQDLLECVVEADSVSQFLFFVKTSSFYFCLMERKHAKVASNLHPAETLMESMNLFCTIVLYGINYPLNFKTIKATRKVCHCLSYP